ncbi:cytochrome C biogenesis protein [Rhodoferax koreense]|uniref:Cytochrome C biogenesis protein n=1 Tax=Rhodoferax koreensis TaxID=1842727 RepID=A0A1P8JTD7_9BURK|nr:DnaJ C-terminal domain-containing protein [Rhodoferax koreense]APW37032.1 cytochrome C biogenesis protein [Rhodoferax koreense]
MEFKDYYKVMGLAREATPEEIKRAYRQLARKNHPDVNKEAGAEQRFKDIGEAYAVLKDPEKRAAYDALGAQREGQEFRPPPDWNANRAHGRDPRGSRESFGDEEAADASDFFETLFRHGFGGAQPRGAPPGGHGFTADGEDQYAKVLIALEDSYAGTTRRIVLRVPERDEQGRVQMREQQLDVTIPRGVRAGQHIRLAGRGAPGMGNGKPGDLFLEVEFEPHAHYRVDKRDVYLDLPVSPWEAALGAEINVPTPSGEVELKIPAGSSAGRKLRLKGRGIPGSTPGDFYFVLQIAVPPADSDAASQLYRDMAAQFKSFNPRAKLGAST